MTLVLFELSELNEHVEFDIGNLEGAEKSDDFLLLQTTSLLTDIGSLEGDINDW